MNIRNIELIEEIIKGFANKHRIAILHILARYPDLDVEHISEKLKVSYTSTAAHLQKMHSAGIIAKEEDGYFVLHKLTPRGKQVFSFLRRLN